MAIRTSEVELLRVRSALIHSIELLSLETLATALFTPISVVSLLSRVGPILVKLQRLVQACTQAVFGYASTEGQLLSEFRDFRISATEVAAGSLVASGLLASGPIWVKSVGGSQAVLAPTSLPELASRLRQLSDRLEPVVRVEKYSGVDGNRFIVYIPGTQNLGLINSNPLDMRSNLRLVAGLSSASSRATDMAIRKAGAGPGDRVMLVGYSQGGLIAAELGKQSKAGQLTYRVEQVVTFGAPVGANSSSVLPNTLSVENKADFVPHLDAISNPKSPNWLTLEGNIAFDPIKNHSMEVYQQILTQNRMLGESKLNPLIANAEQFAAGSGTVSYLELGQKVP